MTEQEITAIVAGIAPVLRDYVDRAVADVGARMATLEAKPYLNFRGVWKGGEAYESGDAATHAGGLWICLKPTSGDPSKDFIAWQLAVKRGSA